jgi:hypothetical protein
MTRPKDWLPVDLESDPVSGDPVAVAKLGRRFRAVADAIREQSGNIAALCGVDGWHRPAHARTGPGGSERGAHRGCWCARGADGQSLGSY